MYPLVFYIFTLQVTDDDVSSNEQGIYLRHTTSSPPTADTFLMSPGVGRSEPTCMCLGQWESDVSLFWQDSVDTALSQRAAGQKHMQGT